MRSQVIRRFSSTTGSSNAVLQYTITDEAPQLATYALLPILKRFLEPQGIEVNATDISLAARIISQFPDVVPADKQKDDSLAQLGKLTQFADTSIIKLPNISASIPQLEGAIAELQASGYPVPNFVASPNNDEERDVLARYTKVLGSAVNPVLREGNSDRRVAAPVKAYAQQSRPPVRMREYPKDSTSRVAHMTEGDFFGSEQSTIAQAGTVRIEFVGSDGTSKILNKEVTLQDGEVIDSSTMSRKALRSFYAKEFADAKESNQMLSLHLKATMMKISDPIIFGHAISVYFDDVADVLEKHNITPNGGLAAVLDRLKALPSGAGDEAIAKINARLAEGAGWAMVDSGKGITNLHSTNDVIIDASIPPLIRDGGKMWSRDDTLQDTKVIIPDRCYAEQYQAVVEDCRVNGQFDHSTMGAVSNVGLMAQKAEEYGSHDKTFVSPGSGTIRVITSDGSKTYFEQTVEEGDLFRMCQTKAEPIKDWVSLAVNRARATGDPTVFWLNPERAHDKTLLGLVDTHLKALDTDGLDIQIMKPKDAMTFTCGRTRAGKNTVTVTGNVLRDYLTDLFPILELGTSAKMLSIVPLLKGGGLFETGAGGSAPKHVQQFLEEGHLRWDSLGEYLAVAVALEHIAATSDNKKAATLAATLNSAVGKVLNNGKSPSRKVNELDNRGTSFFLSQYWAEELANAGEGSFKALSDNINANSDAIVKELVECQGSAVDVGGYYLPDDAKAKAAMCPSQLFNNILDKY